LNENQDIDKQLNHQNDGEDNSLPVVEEPLDPANQSLADALRASFWVLKFVMLVVIVLFLFSGMFVVDQTEVAVLSRFGKLQGAPRQPGLHFAFPFPIDEVTDVTTAPKIINVDDFWLRLSNREKTMDLSDLTPRDKALDPARDGALLTGDRAIMHLLYSAQYRITDPVKFVTNISNEKTTLRKVLQNAAVAESARTTADVVWKNPGRLATAVQLRAQRMLDQLDSGIRLENVAADKSHYPLQTKREFIDVSEAENRKFEAVQGALKFREEELNAAAGPAWKKLAEKIEMFEQVEEGPKREALIEDIERLLVEEATGKAGGKIKLAQRDSDKIVADTLAEVETFRQLLVEYHRNPRLVRQRMRQDMLKKLFEQPGVSKWFFPNGYKRLNVWLNKDPVEIKEAQRRQAQEKLSRQR